MSGPTHPADPCAALARLSQAMAMIERARATYAPRPEGLLVTLDFGAPHGLPDVPALRRELLLAPDPRTRLRLAARLVDSAVERMAAIERS